MSLDYEKESLLFEMTQRYLQLYNTPIKIDGVEYELLRLYELQYKIKKSEETNTSEVTLIIENGFFTMCINSARTSFAHLQNRLQKINEAYKKHKISIKALTSIESAKKYDKEQFWPITKLAIYE